MGTSTFFALAALTLIESPLMIKLFFSYSHRDEELRDELETHLAALKRQGVIETWHDRRITGGKDFGSEISKNLQESQIILLLVSPYFIASDYCYEAEMSMALELHKAGTARVIPVILHPCDWQTLLFGHLQALPKDGKPVSKHPNIHDAFLEVTQGIRRVAEEFEGAGDKQSSRLISAPPGQRSSTHSDIRSSNLRVKKTFTQREKDKFERDAYEYMEKFFENSLAELEARNSNIETVFRSIDANHFLSTVYVDGAEKSSCVIAFPGGESHVGGITFSFGSSMGGMNESLSVGDDGYTMFLKAMGMNLHLDRDTQLTFQGAAEAYWDLFIRNLQR